jgi:hypothetical protein
MVKQSAPWLTCLHGRFYMALNLYPSISGVPLSGPSNCKRAPGESKSLSSPDFIPEPHTSISKIPVFSIIHPEGHVVESICRKEKTYDFGGITLHKIGIRFCSNSDKMCFDFKSFLSLFLRALNLHLMVRMVGQVLIAVSCFCLVPIPMQGHAALDCLNLVSVLKDGDSLVYYIPRLRILNWQRGQA